MLALGKRWEAQVNPWGTDCKIGQVHVVARIDMVLYGCLKLSGSSGKPCRRNWEPSLCTEVTDVDKAGHSFGQAGGMRSNGGRLGV